MLILVVLILASVVTLVTYLWLLVVNDISREYREESWKKNLEDMRLDLKAIKAELEKVEP